MDQPRKQFLAETEDLIEQVFLALDELREQQDNRQRQRELIDEIFRRIHRLKGSAASFGFEGLGEIAHEFENLLSAMRAERITIVDRVLDVCENTATALLESLRLAASGVLEPSRRDLFEDLRALLQGPRTDAPYEESACAAVLSQLPPELSQASTNEEMRRLARGYKEGNCLYVVAASFDIASFDEQFYALKEKLAERGEVISTSPAVDPEHAEKVNFRILFSSPAPLRELESDLLGFPNVLLTELASPASVTAEQHALEPEPLRHTNTSASNFIRTDLDDLNRLISATHELSRLTSRALELNMSTRSNLTELDELAGEIRRSFLAVEDDLIALRMVSLGPILQRAARAGRAAARLGNKQIDFEIVGLDLRLDKLLCDAIGDPLIHLVRNAVDHGIETPESRVKSGKPPRGKVLIEAFREGNRTRLRVTDDGRGVEPDTIAQAASRLGIIEPDRAIDMHRSLRLLFCPGFTTLSAASTVSGRGVGLDIVETAVEQVGGEVRVSSEPGRLTIFEIRLPVTFSLMNATIILAGANRYCLESNQIVKAELFAASAVAANNTGEILRTENGVLPLVRLRELLGQTESTLAGGELNVITCEFQERAAGESSALFETGNGTMLVGVVVDGVAGTEEVLVRNLGRHAGRWYGVAGATELRDGTTALVLDLPRLLSARQITLKA